MRIDVRRTSLPEVLVIEHEVFEDDRGFFMEVYRADQFAEFADLGLPSQYVQLNHSRSAMGVTRGLHFQWDPPMGKLMRVIRGEAFLVAVDIRPGSPTLGRYESVIASDRNRLQLWAPASFARGFCVLSDVAEVEYLTTGTYNSGAESGSVGTTRGSGSIGRSGTRSSRRRTPRHSRSMSGSHGPKPSTSVSRRVRG